MALAITTLLPVQLHSQLGVPRALQYHTASMGSDVRASWANPAGLAVSPEASIMAEFRLDVVDSGSNRLGQYTLGLNSRGFSLVYQRDRFENGLTGSTWRFSVANQFPGGAIGLSYTLYKGSETSDTGYDVGIRYLAIPKVDLGFVARNIGQPIVRDEILDPTAVGSVTLIPANSLRISGEVLAVAPSGLTSVELGYRFLLLLTSPSGTSSLTGSVTLDDNLSVGRLSVGLSLGGTAQGMVMTSFDQVAGSASLEAISFTGVSRRRFAPLRR